MYRLVVFDLDGTLADTLSDLAHSMNKALESENLPVHPVESYRKFVGNGISNLVKQVVMDKADDEKLCRRVKAYFDSYYSQHLCDFTKAYDGMNEVLSELRRMDVKTAVHSNKPHTFVPQILKTLYPEHVFELAWGHKDGFERKPSPQALETIIEQLSCDKKSTLYVGDSDVDVFTAHNAGVKVCGVEWGFRGKEELALAGADFLAKDAKNLLDIIKGI